MEADPRTGPEPRRPPREDLAVWVRDILLPLSVAAVVIVFLCQLVRVGSSRVTDGQRTFVGKTAPIASTALGEGA